MSDWITAVLVVLGSALMLVAAIGLARFPDTVTRVQAATKAGTLGVGFLVAAVAVHFGDAAVTAYASLIVVFFLLTGPAAAYRIARAAYRTRVPLWRGTHHDELAGTPKEPESAARPPPD